MLRYQPTRDNPNDQVSSATKNSLINCLPEQYRNEMMPDAERYYQQMLLNNNKVSTDLNPFLNQDQKTKRPKNKQRNLRKFKSFNSSEDSEDYDLNRNGHVMGQQSRLQRETSKDDDEDEDDEYLVDNETNTYNYGSVPYQYGGSSSKR